MIFLADEISLEKIIKFIRRYHQYDRPILEKYLRYYQGDHDILRKMVNDATKPCNRIITNFCYSIVENYQGYLTGKDIAYTSPEDISPIVDVLSYNDVRTEDNELLRQALIYGKSFEVCYVDEDMKQRFKVLDTRECIPIFRNTLNQDLLCVIRYYPVDSLDLTKGWNVDIYYEDRIEHYVANTGFTTLTYISDEPHFYGQVPITIFSLNQEEKSVFDKVTTLQDAYNTLLSAEVDDFQAFCDAYLVMKGIQATEEDIQSMKENRVLLVGDNGEVSYVNKQISDTQIENMLANIEKKIHIISNSPDFTDNDFGVSSGVAMQYKLLGFENAASSIVANMTKALQKRIELICAILSKTEGDEMWRDVEISFTRNLPIDLAEIANLVNTLKGTVSDKTLLSLLPFVSDIDKELEMVEESKEKSMEIYGFGTNNFNEEINNEQ